MAVSQSFRAFVLDQLSEVPDLTARSMFGGVGLYSAGCFFAIVWKDTLFLKVDDTTRPTYEAAGMKPFNPMPGRGGTFQYYQVPVGVLESAEELARWARQAVKVARRGPVRLDRSPERARRTQRPRERTQRRDRKARRD